MGNDKIAVYKKHCLCLRLHYKVFSAKVDMQYRLKHTFHCRLQPTSSAHTGKRKSYRITGLARALRLQEFEASRMFRQSAHEGGKAVDVV
jgi:hypothetical protein